MKGGGSDGRRRFCVDLSFGETKFVLGCFLRSSGLSDPGRVAASQALKLLNRGVSAAGIAGREDLTAKPSRREMAPQRLEKIESAPGNGMVSEAWKPQDMVHGRAADRAPLLRAARMTS
jgi:hypothetical protein